MCAIELKITVEQARNRLSVISHSVFEQGLAEHWVSDEQGELNPRSVFWLFKWALAGNSDSNAHRSAGEEAARIFDSINLTNGWPSGYRRMKLIGCADRTGRRGAP